MLLSKRNYSYPDILLLPLKCAPVWTLLWILTYSSAAIVNTLWIIFTARFLDSATDVVLHGANPSDVILPLIFVMLTITWNWTMQHHVSSLFISRFSMAARTKLRAELTERRAKLKYRYIEDAEAWDLIERVCKEPEQRMQEGLSALTGLAEMVIRIAGIMWILIAEVWWAALIITAATVPLMLLAMKSGKASYQADRDNTKIKRKYEYLSDVLMGRETAGERSFFGFGHKFNEIYKTEYDTAYRHSYKVRAGWFGRRLISGLIFALIAVLISFVLLPATLYGALSFGLFVSLSNAVGGMVNMIAWSLGWQVDNVAKRREALRDLTDFMALEDAEGALDAPGTPLEFDKLELKNVRFTYPGTDREILSGLSLTIEKNRHYSFVGVNGAGKTTVTKILTGLYPEYEGEILLNGKELRDYTQAELKACFSLVYQDFAKYNAPLKDNIAFEIEGREAQVVSVIKTVGLEDSVKKLPQGAGTPLGKVDGEGQDLSGGEWQRLAMARAIVNPAPVRILDEPTAALDPVSESRVYSEFEKISRGRTTVFISHRLGSTALADTIFVLKDGRVLEEGSHEALMACKGLYAEMYASQRSWYE